MHAMQSYLNSFSCFVENNSKTTARVVAVCEICMSSAAIKRGRGDVDVDRLRFHAAMIDVEIYRCALVSQRRLNANVLDANVLSAVCCFLTSKATAYSPE